MKESEANELASLWITRRLTVAWVLTALIVAATVVSLKGMSATTPKQLPGKVRVDTLRIITTVYDTVISKAPDTVRIIEHTVGPLTEQRLVRLVCGTKEYGDLTYGDDRDVFGFNLMGMVFCPRKPTVKE